MLNKTTTFEEFSALLMQEHGIAVKESRGRLSYCPPGRTKFITAKKLSKKLEKEQVLTALSQNIQLAAIIQPSSEKKPDMVYRLRINPKPAHFFGKAVVIISRIDHNGRRPRSFRSPPAWWEIRSVQSHQSHRS